MEHWHDKSIVETVEFFGTDPVSGRVAESVAPVQKSEGKETGIFKITAADKKEAFLSVVSDAVLPFFLVALLIYFLTGRYQVSAIIAAVLFISYGLSTALKYRTRKVLEEKDLKLVPEARRIIDGKERRTRQDSVCVGDLITFSVGDIIPADARLVYTDSLRVLEYRIDEKNGKKIINTVSKDADRQYDGKNELPTYENMIYAGSLISSGHGRAIVTAIGADTRASVLDIGVRKVADNSSPEFHAGFVKRARIFSAIMLIAVLPLTLYELIALKSQPAGIDLLTLFMTFLSLAAVSFGEQTLSLSEILVSGYSHYSGQNTTDAAGVTQPGKTEYVSAADTLVIMNEDLICDREIRVRNIYFNGKELNGAEMQRSALKPLIQRALILDRVFKQSVNGVSNTIRTGRAFDDLAEKLNIDQARIFTREAQMIPDTSELGRGRFSTLVRISNSRGRAEARITRSLQFSSVAECRGMRNADGEIIPLTKEICTNASEVYVGMIEKGFTPLIITSSESRTEGITFEGIIAIGGVFPDSNAEAVGKLISYGVRPVLILENDTMYNRRIARNCGISSNDSEIAIASEFSGNGLAEMDDERLKNYSAFVGFGSTGTAEIIRRLTSAGADVLTVVRDIKQFGSIRQLRRSAAENGNKTAAAAASVCGCSQQAVLLESACRFSRCDEKRKNSGLYSALEVLKDAAASKIRLHIFRNYLIFTAAMRIFAVLLPVLFNKASCIPNMFQIFTAGFLADLAAVTVIAGDKLDVPSVDSAKKLFTGISLRADLVRYSSLGLLSGIAIPVTGLMLYGYDSMTTAGNVLYISASMILSEFAALFGMRLVSRKKYGLKSVNTLFAAICAASLVLLCAISYIPVSGGTAAEVFGMGARSLYPVLQAVIPAFLAFVFSVVIDCIGLFTGTFQDRD